MNNIRTIIMRLFAPLTLMVLAGCATSFKADVSRFQAMPAPAGQSFVIQPADPTLSGGLEFANYAKLVATKMEANGYRPASDAKDASLIVWLDYGVDKGVEKTVTYPRSYSSFGMGYGWNRYPFGGGPYWGGYPYWGRYPYYGSPYYSGWYDPFWYDPWAYSETESYTVYTSFLDLKIARSSDGDRVFEGVAKARSTHDRLTELVPNLIEAMFTGFPGNSGEEIRITVPPVAKRR